MSKTNVLLDNPEIAEAESQINLIYGVSRLGSFERRFQGKLVCRVSLPAPGGNDIPVRTNWYIVCDGMSRSDAIDIFPDKEGGIKTTYPHQNWNGPLDDCPWLSGSLCVRNRISHRLGMGGEPDKFVERVVWLLNGAIRWLDAASAAHLIQQGEHFELPPLPEQKAHEILFSEGPDMELLNQPVRYGVAKLLCLFHSETVIIQDFSDIHGSPLVNVNWGPGITSLPGKKRYAGWILLRELPVVSQWHIPAMWRDLLAILQRTEAYRNFYDLRRKSYLRENSNRYLLVGCPIPEVVEGPSARIHWFAIDIDSLSISSSPPSGFRNTNSSMRLYDKTTLEQKSITYCKSTNCHETALVARGVHLPLFVRKCLLIGCGALGSTTGELLVRSGLRSLHLVDSDRIMVGNLTRHTALVIDINRPKSIVVGDRLSLSYPHVQVSHSATQYTIKTRAKVEQGINCNMILDCSANDDVLLALATFEREEAVWFFSVWLGNEGKRVYIYSFYGKQFPIDDWRCSWAPWRKVEGERVGAWEDTGCWHPVYPARADDIWLGASVIVQTLVTVLERDQSGLVVFERGADEQGYSCLRRVETPREG